MQRRNFIWFYIFLLEILQSVSRFIIYIFDKNFRVCSCRSLEKNFLKNSRAEQRWN